MNLVGSEPIDWLAMTTDIPCTQRVGAHFKEPI